MREAFRRRVEVLEEARELQDGEPFTININFIRGDKTPVVATQARAMGTDFICYRGEGEDADAFKSRANSECRPPISRVTTTTATPRSIRQAATMLKRRQNIPSAFCRGCASLWISGQAPDSASGKH